MENRVHIGIFKRSTNKLDRNIFTLQKWLNIYMKFNSIFDPAIFLDTLIYELHSIPF